jgi:hypothetical protein
MTRVSWFAASLLLATLVSQALPRAAAQAPAAAPAQAAPSAPAPPAPTKSVYGKLLNVDTRLNSVLMAEDSGAQLAWQFNAAVIAEAARFKAGDPLIVIYRQIGPGPKDKRVTAIAFPGSAKSPIYFNMTGDRVVLRSAAGVDGACDKTAGAVSESVIPAGGLAEVLEACWCCAPAGEACTPGTRSGLGRAYLAQCFK